MIVVRLMGGLGNQLFQWAYGKCLSVRYGHELYLDVSFLDSEYEGITKREFSLAKLGIEDQACVFREQGLTLVTDEIPFSHRPGESYLIQGYFQNERNFMEIASYVRAAIGPGSEFRERSGISAGDVSMHVRRTDYLSSNGAHPVQDAGYYEEAISLIGGYERILIFSDDHEWCMQNLSFERAFLAGGRDDAEDMLLMSLCGDNIIANSSFSWWSAWLNERRGKKVVYPKRWFGYGACDIPCLSWTGI